MYTVVNQLRAGKYISLVLDRQIAEHAYDTVLCDGMEYDIVPSYGTDDIVVEAENDFLNKRIKLVDSGRRANTT